MSTGKPRDLMFGYLLGAGVMAIGGITEALIGVKAERTSLEDVVNPLTVVTRPRGGISAATA